jgi:hypothetical protein
MTADELDLADERRLLPRTAGCDRSPQLALQVEGIQRQRPIWRRRWSWSESPSRWEEILGRTG